MTENKNIQVIAVIENGIILHVYSDLPNVKFSIIDLDAQNSYDYGAALDALYEIEHDDAFTKI